jgi:hypothetical protein
MTANGLGSLFPLTLPTRTLADVDFRRYSHYSATAANGSRLLLGAFCSQIVHQRPTGAHKLREFLLSAKAQSSSALPKQIGRRRATTILDLNADDAIRRGR